MFKRTFQVLAFLCLSAAAGSVSASAVSINLSSLPYSGIPATRGISVHDIWELRVAAISAAAATYRINHGVTTLPVGSIITVTYTDGSKEKASVTSPSSSAGVKEIPGTQVSGQPTAGGGGGEGGGGGGGGLGGGGSGPIGGCYGKCHGEVTVGA